MTKIMKVLDKGVPGGKGKKAEPSKVLQRFSVDANEIVASDPERFVIVDDATPHDEDIQGNPVRARDKPAKFVKNPAAGESGALPLKEDETE